MTPAPFERHIFVCVHDRPEPGRPACGTRGGGALLERLQQRVLAHPDLPARVCVTPCGCLGRCFDGPTVVVYPEGVWYAGVEPGDADEIVALHLEGGRPITRLLAPE